MPEADSAQKDQLGLRGLEPFTTQERILDPDDLPWITYTDTISFKPLRLNRRTGQWSTLTKIVGGGHAGRHYHTASVIGHVLEGSWYYVERDWVAKPGMIVWEPPGDIHTLMTNQEGTLTIFNHEGSLLYMDDDDNLIGYDDVLTITRLYHEHCERKGIEPLDLDY
ncbi:MAG: 2,4'-dihydroxyacetophenone dioxygenase family protein [Actinobacteria bacterium]|nr:2,4'-dihydroxyacetophenone dioxygenase family protein [Actinomycetota bacterium]